MRTEDFTALVDALLPDDDGTAAFLYAKQATFFELGVRQLLFFLAETTPLRLRSLLADEANAAALVQLLSKCGLAAEDDLRLVRRPPATFRSLGSAPVHSSMGATDDSVPQFTTDPGASQPEDDTSARDSAPMYCALSAEDSQPHEDGTSGPVVRSLPAQEPEASQLEENDTSASRFAMMWQQAESKGLTLADSMKAS